MTACRGRPALRRQLRHRRVCGAPTRRRAGPPAGAAAPRTSLCQAGGSSPVAGAVSSTIQMSDVPPLDRILRGEAPTYDALVNYPRAKARGARHCVMCGRQPSADAGRAPPVPRPPQPRGNPPVTVVVSGQRTPQKTIPGQEPVTPATPPPMPPIRRGGAVIPKQNKDVTRVVSFNFSTCGEWRQGRRRCTAAPRE